MADRNTPRYTVPSLTPQQGAKVATILQERLNSLTDLHLTLKHVHWNVVGPHFIAVHEMLDPQVDAVRAMTDAVAERIATLGASPVGTPGALVAARTWDDYALHRASAIEHLGALDEVYQGVITAHRKAAKDTESLDDVTNDLLIGHLHELELFHWFVRAHLESAGGDLSTAGATTEKAAAQKAAEGTRSASTRSTGAKAATKSPAAKTGSARATTARKKK
ncbi:Dps family protein [Isoptericola sp. NPDC057391]|uniref:Dps family protein n=1 Tax=Isoptericola sp. NPDC057391 TaxID=3346117 RepID=UPI0036300505